MPIREHPTHSRRSWLGLTPVFILATLTAFLKDAGWVVRLIGSAEALAASLVLCAADPRHSYYRCLSCAVVWRSSFVILGKAGTPQ